MSHNFDDQTDIRFNEIARQLLLHYDLTVNDKKYAITEIEFYWNTEKHPDGSVYKRIHTGNLKAGQIFVHYSDIDIFLDNEFGIGGILIRGICSRDNIAAGIIFLLAVIFFIMYYYLFNILST